MKQLFFLTLVSLTLACNPTEAQEQTASQTTTVEQQETDYRVLAVADYKKELQDDNVLLVDVRTPQEYSSGHIEGAINVNVMDPGFATQIKAEVDANKQVMIYCRSGSRSARATRIMKELGYPVIYDLKGGYMAWQRQ
jgi:rhodanese-related sulfurtransferase